MMNNLLFLAILLILIIKVAQALPQCSITDCSVCSRNSEYQCITCKPGYFLDESSQKCIKNTCPSYKFYSSILDECVSTCPLHSIEDYESGTCTLTPACARSLINGENLVDGSSLKEVIIVASHQIIVGFFNSDQYIRIWDVTTKSLIVKLKAFTEPILGMRYIAPRTEPAICTLNPFLWCAQPLLILWSQKAEIKIYNLSAMILLFQTYNFSQQSNQYIISSLSNSLYHNNSILICANSDTLFTCIQIEANTYYPTTIFEQEITIQSQVFASMISTLTFDIIYVSQQGIARIVNSGDGWGNQNDISLKLFQKAVKSVTTPTTGSTSSQQQHVLETAQFDIAFSLQTSQQIRKSMHRKTEIAIITAENNTLVVFEPATMRTGSITFESTVTIVHAFHYVPTSTTSTEISPFLIVVMASSISLMEIRTTPDSDLYFSLIPYREFTFIDLIGKSVTAIVATNYRSTIAFATASSELYIFQTLLTLTNSSSTSDSVSVDISMNLLAVQAVSALNQISFHKNVTSYIAEDGSARTNTSFSLLLFSDLMEFIILPSNFTEKEILQSPVTQTQLTLNRLINYKQRKQATSFSVLSLLQVRELEYMLLIVSHAGSFLRIWQTASQRNHLLDIKLPAGMNCYFLASNSNQGYFMAFLSKILPTTTSYSTNNYSANKPDSRINFYSLNTYELLYSLEIPNLLGQSILMNGVTVLATSTSMLILEVTCVHSQSGQVVSFSIQQHPIVIPSTVDPNNNSLLANVFFMQKYSDNSLIVCRQSGVTIIEGIAPAVYGSNDATFITVNVIDAYFKTRSNTILNCSIDISMDRIALYYDNNQPGIEVLSFTHGFTLLYTAQLLKNEFAQEGLFLSGNELIVNVLNPFRSPINDFRTYFLEDGTQNMFYIYSSANLMFLLPDVFQGYSKDHFGIVFRKKQAPASSANLLIMSRNRAVKSALSVTAYHLSAETCDYFQYDSEENSFTLGCISGNVAKKYLPDFKNTPMRIPYKLQNVESFRIYDTVSVLLAFQVAPVFAIQIFNFKTLESLGVLEFDLENETLVKVIEIPDEFKLIIASNFRYVVYAFSDITGKKSSGNKNLSKDPPNLFNSCLSFIIGMTLQYNGFLKFRSEISGCFYYAKLNQLYVFLDSVISLELGAAGDSMRGEINHSDDPINSENSLFDCKYVERTDLMICLEVLLGFKMNQVLVSLTNILTSETLYEIEKSRLSRFDGFLIDEINETFFIFGDRIEVFRISDGEILLQFNLPSGALADAFFIEKFFVAFNSQGCNDYTTYQKDYYLISRHVSSDNSMELMSSAFSGTYIGSLHIRYINCLAFYTTDVSFGLFSLIELKTGSIIGKQGLLSKKEAIQWMQYDPSTHSTMVKFSTGALTRIRFDFSLFADSQFYHAAFDEPGMLAQFQLHLPTSRIVTSSGSALMIFEYDSMRDPYQFYATFTAKIFRRLCSPIAASMSTTSSYSSTSHSGSSDELLLNNNAISNLLFFVDDWNSIWMYEDAFEGFTQIYVHSSTAIPIQSIDPFNADPTQESIQNVILAFFTSESLYFLRINSTDHSSNLLSTHIPISQRRYLSTVQMRRFPTSGLSSAEEAKQPFDLVVIGIENTITAIRMSEPPQITFESGSICRKYHSHSLSFSKSILFVSCLDNRLYAYFSTKQRFEIVIDAPTNNPSQTEVDLYQIFEISQQTSATSLIFVVNKLNARETYAIQITTDSNNQQALLVTPVSVDALTKELLSGDPLTTNLFNPSYISDFMSYFDDKTCTLVLKYKSSKLTYIFTLLSIISDDSSNKFQLDFITSIQLEKISVLEFFLRDGFLFVVHKNTIAYYDASNEYRILGSTNVFQYSLKMPKYIYVRLNVLVIQVDTVIQVYQISSRTKKIALVFEVSDTNIRLQSAYIPISQSPLSQDQLRKKPESNPLTISTRYLTLVYDSKSRVFINSIKLIEERILAAIDKDPLTINAKLSWIPRTKCTALFSNDSVYSFLKATSQIDNSYQTPLSTLNINGNTFLHENLLLLDSNQITFFQAPQKRQNTSRPTYRLRLTQNLLNQLVVPTVRILNSQLILLSDLQTLQLPAVTQRVFFSNVTFLSGESSQYIQNTIIRFSNLKSMSFEGITFSNMTYSINSASSTILSLERIQDVLIQNLSYINCTFLGLEHLIRVSNSYSVVFDTVKIIDSRFTFNSTDQAGIIKLTSASYAKLLDIQITNTTNEFIPASTSQQTRIRRSLDGEMEADALTKNTTVSIPAYCESTGVGATVLSIDGILNTEITNAQFSYNKEFILLETDPTYIDYYYQKVTLYKDELIINSSEFFENSLLNTCGFYRQQVTSGAASTTITAASSLSVSTSTSTNTDNSMVILASNFITLKSVEFSRNSCKQCAGTISIMSASKATITECKFKGNLARDGAAFRAYYMLYGIFLMNSEFEGNTVTRYGGAIFFDHSELMDIRDCVFRNNSALIGGAIRQIGVYSSSLFELDPVSQNVTFDKNSAVMYGTDVGFYPTSFELSFKVYETAGTFSNANSTNSTSSDATASTVDSSQYSTQSDILISSKDISHEQLRSGASIDVFIAFYDHTGRAITASTSNLSVEQLYERALELSQSRSKIYAVMSSSKSTTSESTSNDVTSTSSMDDRNSSTTESAQNENTVDDSESSENNNQLTGSIEIQGQKMASLSDSYLESKELFVFSNITVLGSFGKCSSMGVESEFINTAFSSVMKKKEISELALCFRECKVGEIPVFDSNSLWTCQKCHEGTYSLTGNITLDEQHPVKCKSCPKGVLKCEANVLSLANGYWSLHENSDTVVQCREGSNVCLAEQSSDFSKICKEGHIGPLCESCDTVGVIWGQRYQRSIDNGCKTCSGDIMSSLVLFQSFCLLLLLVQLSMILVYTNQMNYLQCYYLRKIGILPIVKPLNTGKAYTYFKSYYFYMQFYNMIGVKKFVEESNSLANPQLLISNFLDCFIPTSLVGNLIHYRIIVFTIQVVLYFFFAIFVFRFFNSNLKRWFKPITWMMALVAVIFQAPQAIEMTLKSLLCEEIGGISYSMADLKSECRASFSESSKPIEMLFSAIILVAFYITPLIYFQVLRKNKDKFNQVDFRMKLGFVYEDFTGDYFYWDIIRNQVRQNFIIIGIILQNHESSRQILTFMQLFAMSVFSTNRRIFINQNVQRVDELMNCLIMLIIFAKLTISSTGISVNDIVDSAAFLITVLFTSYSYFKIIYELGFSFNEMQHHFKFTLLVKTMFRLLERFAFKCALIITKDKRRIELMNTKSLQALLNWKSIATNRSKLYKLKVAKKSKFFGNSEYIINASTNTLIQGEKVKSHETDSIRQFDIESEKFPLQSEFEP